MTILQSTTGREKAGARERFACQSARSESSTSDLNMPLRNDKALKSSKMDVQLSSYEM